jgi:hypothetical protein
VRVVAKELRQQGKKVLVIVDKQQQRRLVRIAGIQCIRLHGRLSYARKDSREGTLRFAGDPVLLPHLKSQPNAIVVVRNHDEDGIGSGMFGVRRELDRFAI